MDMVILEERSDLLQSALGAVRPEDCHHGIADARLSCEIGDVGLEWRAMNHKSLP